MVYYDRILQTGLQSLLAVACGWGCGRWRLVDAEPTVQQVNHLVLKFCIPCLQIWLLAFKTDMQRAENWWALAAFLAWSLGLQAFLLLHQLATQRRLQLDRLGVEGLILTTNNTGILGPVVLEAAVGSRYAPLGMLATVALYFQQLPLAQLLFQLHSQQQQQQQQQQQIKVGPAMSPPAAAAAADGSSAAASVAAAAGLKGSKGKLATSPEPSMTGVQLNEVVAGSSNMSSTSNGTCTVLHFDSSSHLVQLRHLHHTTGQQQQQEVQHVQTGQQQQQQQHRQRLSWDLEEQQQHHMPNKASVGSEEAAGLLEGNCRQLLQPLHEGSIAAHSLSLLVKNPLVWSTAIPLMLSACGSAALLDPSSPLAFKQLAFLEACLAWFAQATAPLTLFTTGLWMFSNSNSGQLQQQRHCVQGSVDPAAAAAGLAATVPPAAGSAGHYSSVSQLPAAFGSQGVPWADVLRYLLLRATLAPAFMVVVCWLLGFRGDMAHALVILALLPVAQTAFVVCKQAEVGMAAVALMLVASLLVMLPQLMLVLAVLERLGLLA